MSKEAIFSIESNTQERLIIRDLGPWSVVLTVTNDAEDVVERLYKTRQLVDGKQLWYFDSEGGLSELLHAGGKFTGFGPSEPVS